MPRARVTDMELVKHFLVVHWDQRGAGKSLTAGLGPGALSIERLVADVCELARLMEDRFGGRRIVLVGSSWGTDLGAYAVARCPEQFAAWVSISTDVNPRRAEQISYQFVLEQARAAGDAAAIRALESIGPPPYQSLFALARERRWLERYGGEYQDAAAQEELRQAIWASPEYSLLDLLRIPVGNMLSLHELYFENAERVDLIAQVPRIEVPVIFFQGRRDFSTPGSLVEEYFTRLEAPHGKELVWFEKSSHAVPADEPGRFAEVMVERVLPLAR